MPGLSFSGDLIFCKSCDHACLLYIVAVEDIESKFAAYSKEEFHMSKTQDAKKTEKKKPLKTAKEKKQAKQEKKKNK